MNGEDPETFVDQVVRGVGTAVCAAAWVYYDRSGALTIAADDAEGEPVGIVTRVVAAGRCDFRELTPYDLGAWRRAWGAPERSSRRRVTSAAEAGRRR